MTETMVLRYKCRRCGKVHDGAISCWRNAPMTLVSIIGGTVPNLIGGCMATAQSICSCDDGGLGISDAIGVDRREG